MQGLVRVRLRPCCLRRTCFARCEPSKGSDHSKPADGTSEKSEKVRDTVRELRKADVDKETAQEIMRLWSESGVTDDPEELRKLYRKRGGATYARIGIQLLLDAVACFASFKAVEALSAGDDFFGRPVVTFIFSAVAFNYALAFFANIAGFVLSVRSMQMFGTNAAAYMEAIKEIAGPSSVETMSSFTRAIDSFKIVNTLQDMDRYLKSKAEGGGEKGSVSTLESLSVYLTLDKARQLHGFKQEDFGLNDAESFNIARIFSKYDTNDDYRLDQNEFEKLCRDTGKDLERVEAREVLRAIDADDSGCIDFKEFVRFWTKPDEAVEKVKTTLSESESDSEGKTEQLQTAEKKA